MGDTAFVGNVRTEPSRELSFKEDYELIDSFGRRVTYLRVSITDRCNLRCWYCMPSHCKWLPREEVLAYEELLRVVAVGASLGISKVRLTGGEPLVRKGLPWLISKIVETPGVEEVALTTNGTLLARQVTDLKSSGLNRVNISIDTLDSERYESITRGGRLSDVIVGIDAAVAAGFRCVKLNSVLQRDADIADVYSLVEFARARRVRLRFIELMPLANEVRGGARYDSSFISAREVKARLEGVDTGHVEFISPVSQPFCDTCNRLRLTPDGKLLACLCRGGAVDIKAIVRDNRCGGHHRRLAQAFHRCLGLKPEPWRAWGGTARLERVSAIGG
ncbi:MAG: GTP 3',8-cyclase MoaA [Armatimonadota bacterium]|nr:GTP 3',8-cyclase MoaA [Armatimonadota bacterium]